MSNDLPMMPWFPEPFLAATFGWRFAERSAYRALLDQQWILGALPDDADRLALLADMESDEFAKVWPVVRTKFVSTAGGLINERLEIHRAEAVRRKTSFQRAANATNEKRKVAHTAGAREACEVKDGTRDAMRDASRASLSSSLSSLQNLNPSSDSDVRAREESAFHVDQPGAEAWKDTAGLNVDAFDSYLNHVSILVREGRVRAQLPPHSKLEQARWLAMQGTYGKQLDIVTRAIRNGWKSLQADNDRRAGTRSRFDETHSQG